MYNKGEVMLKLNIDDINKGTRVSLIGVGVSFNLKDDESITMDIDGLTGTVLQKLNSSQFVSYLVRMDESARKAHHKLKNVSLEWKITAMMVEKL